VWVDGAEVGVAPTTFELKPDTEHVLEIRRDGYQPHRETLRLSAGDMRPISVSLIKLPSTLSIRVSLPGAEVKVDGKVVGKSGKQPLLVNDVTADVEHDVEAVLVRGKDKLRASARETPRPGEVTAVELRLQARPPPPPPPPVVAPVVAGKGMLTIKTTPWARILIDGQSFGSTPVAKVPLAAGAHTLRLINEQASIDVTRKITIVAGETLKLDLALK
jgi:hypothetical protein